MKHGQFTVSVSGISVELSVEVSLAIIDDVVVSEVVPEVDAVVKRV
jgi:hypothetical protein